jgi:Carboxypeptidase regulatory-like domain
VFSLIGLPAPGTYEISASAPGLSSQTRTIALQPGQHIDKVALLLQPGVGVVSGRVVDGTGAPVSGASVTLISGASRQGTITLSGDAATAGRFELRELTVPSTLSLSVSAPGYLTASETVVLDNQNTRADRSITLRLAGASLGGIVRASDGHAVGGVTVTISGGSFKRTTQTLSQGEVGHWLVTDVPTPGNYTVTFTADKTVPVTQAVDLPSGSTGRLDVNVTVSSAVASVNGLVRELGSRPDDVTCNPTDAVLTDCPSRLAGVSVVLSATGVERKTFTAHMPTGAFQMGDLAPGPYTVTFSRVGSSPQTFFVELAAAQNLTIPDIFLEPQARVSGQVTHIGLPTSNVSVRVYLASKYPQVAEATAITDASGHYTIVGLVAPETYIVEFQYPIGGQIVASKEIFLQPGAVANGDQAI